MHPPASKLAWLWEEAVLSAASVKSCQKLSEAINCLLALYLAYINVGWSDSYIYARLHQLSQHAASYCH